MDFNGEDQNFQYKKLCIIHHNCIVEWCWLSPNLS